MEYLHAVGNNVHVYTVDSYTQWTIYIHLKKIKYYIFLFYFILLWPLILSYIPNFTGEGVLSLQNLCMPDPFVYMNHLITIKKLFKPNQIIDSLIHSRPSLMLSPLTIIFQTQKTSTIIFFFWRHDSIYNPHLTLP